MRALPHSRGLSMLGTMRARLDDIRDAVLTRVEGGTIPEPLRVPPAAEQWLPDAVRALTPNRYWAARRPNLIKPIEAVYWHYTASPYNPRYPLGADIERIKRWTRRTTGRVSSTHVVYLRDGRRVQLMPFGDRAWHITNRYPHHITGAYPNETGLGLDLENVGWLRKSGRDFYTAYDSLHRGPVAQADDGSWWEAPTDEQMRAIEDDAAIIAAGLPQLADGAPGRVVRHSEVQPTRSDPGPLFDTAWYARLLTAGAS